MEEENVKAEYDRLAGEYDTRWRKYLASTHEKALILLDPGPDDHILDVSGGTGLLAKAVCERFGAEVTLVDFSEEMLRKAEQRTAGLDDVNIKQADAHDLPFPDETFDKVTCLSALHFYEDPPTALREMHRVLVPGGTVVLIDWRADPVYFKLIDLMLRILRRPHVKTYTTAGLSRLLRDAGFEVERTVRWRSGWWPLAGFRAIKQD